MRLRRLLPLLALGLLAAGPTACGSEERRDERPAAPAPAARAGGAAGTVPATDSCEPGALPLVEPGTLTVASAEPQDREAFERALVAAVADQLGIPAGGVTWTVLSLRSTLAPGPKPFDVAVGGIAITPERAEQVDFSNPYFEAPGGEQWGMALARGSALTACVNLALDALESTGELDALADRRPR